MAKEFRSTRGQSTRGQKVQRVNEIAELLLRNFSRSFILEHCATHYKIKTRASDLLIRAANDRILEVNEGSIEKSLAQVLAGFWRVYRNAEVANDRSAQISALKEIAKLKGLDETRIHLKIDRPLEELSDDDLSEGLSDE